jgi:hypothetical protein
MLWYQAGCCWAPRGRGHHENATLAVVHSRHGRRPGLPAACAHGVQVEHVHAAEPVAASPVDPLHERHDELGDQARWGFGTAGAGGWLLDGHGAAFQRAAAVSASAGRPAAASHRERRAGGGRSGLCSSDVIAADQAATLGGSMSPLWPSMSAVSSPPMCEAMTAAPVLGNLDRIITALADSHSSDEAGGSDEG